MSPFRARLLASLSVGAALILAPAARAADESAIRAAIAKATAHLVAKGQAEDGSFSAEAGPAVTALVVTALRRTGTPADAPAVKKGIGYLLSFRRDDGAIAGKESPVANYETSIALMALVACNGDGRYAKEVESATAFLKGLQWDDGEGKAAADPAHGGAGYGRKSRPDLSNTAFFVEALRAAGVSADDPAIQKALVFVSRTQNLVGPENTAGLAEKNTNPDDKGGFYYTPASGGESQAGERSEGGLRSYGSMTYAGLKSMIFAGLGKDDPRVKAAIDWLRRHYTFAENPGMGEAGLYYYFQTASKALDVVGESPFIDAAGKAHDWRAELSDALLARQREDGSWANDNKRFMEDNANLVTSYVLLALANCLPK
ncbi:MAG: prenyltransferase/squalene oxidase repeat-containing protein [Planctomycetaceae bacterium]